MHLILYVVYGIIIFFFWCMESVVAVCVLFFFFKQKTAYEMRISDWSSDVCSSDLQDRDTRRAAAEEARARLSQAIADRDLARINLERAEVRSPVNGIVTNFQLRRGIYANAGQPVMTLVD